MGKRQKELEKVKEQERRRRQQQQLRNAKLQDHQREMDCEPSYYSEDEEEFQLVRGMDGRLYHVRNPSYERQQQRRRRRRQKQQNQRSSSRRQHNNEDDDDEFEIVRG